jgi:hypothetical protein
VDSQHPLWQVVKAIHDDLEKVDVTHTMVKHAEYRRGGFGSRSIPEGSRSAEMPCPVSQYVTAVDAAGVPTGWSQITSGDRTDREANRRARSYTRNLESAQRFLRAAIYDQSWFLETADPVPDPGIVPCANNDCGEAIEEGRKSGECAKCRQHRHRHGLAWPKLPHEVAS